MSSPLPPSDLWKRSPEIFELKANASLHRFFSARHEPIFFDAGQSGRLNAPDGSYRVLYAAADRRGAFAEAFLRTPGRTQVDTTLLAAKGYVQLTNTRPLSFIKLAGPGLARVGATAEIVHGGLPYQPYQAWSKALADHPQAADGIAYTARHDDEQMCFAIFDRAAGAISEVEKRVDLDQDWFWELAEIYGVGLSPS